MLFVGLNGCTQTRLCQVKPSFELPKAFSLKGDQELPKKWWQSLNDAQLDSVIEESLGNNFTIRSAWDRLTQAEQTAIKAGADLYPSVTYRGHAERIRVEGDEDATYTSDYSASLIVGYEVDLWGRIKSAHQAAILDTEAAQENVSAAAMTLTATISKTWYQLAEAKQKEKIIERQIQTNEKILEVIRVQFRQAQVAAADVFSQERLVQSSRGQLIRVKENIAVLQNKLSILMGKTPGPWWSDTSIELISLSQLPKIDVPSVVIQRRPDVIRSYKIVQSADQLLASAIADQYPTISLSAGAETYATRPVDLFDHWLANLAANLAGPLFDAGYRKAEVKRRLAIVSERLNDYSQLVLEALRETEDAISQENYQRLYLESLQKELALARDVYDRTYQNYLKGQLDYLRVLDAVVTMQDLEQNELTARRVLIERRIDLCRSIAGGWPLQRPENPKLSK